MNDVTASALQTIQGMARSTPVQHAQHLSSAQIDHAAQEFEALFAAQMIKPMFEGLKSDGVFSGGFAEKAWRGVLVEAIGDQIAAGGGLGIADAVREALITAQSPADIPFSQDV